CIAVMKAFTRSFFFFFQAEDGIRDDLVTGVQTCALPIYRVDGRVLLERTLEEADRREHSGRPVGIGDKSSDRAMLAGRLLNEGRSEERRVGKGVERGGRGAVRKTNRDGSRREAHARRAAQ